MFSRRDFLKTSAVAAILPMVKIGSTKPKVKPKCPLVGDEIALGACATNGRLLRMLNKFERRNGGFKRLNGGLTFVGKLRRLVAKHPRYFVEMRIYFDLDTSAGWFNRHINEFR